MIPDNFPFLVHGFVEQQQTRESLATIDSRAVWLSSMAFLQWGDIAATGQELWEDDTSSAVLPLPAPEPSFAPRADQILPTLVPHYRILSTIGEGAFASVFAAKHRFFRKNVAIKYMDITPADVHLAMDRETKAMKLLSHPCCLKLNKVKRKLSRVAVITPLLRTTLSAALNAEFQGAPIARWDGSAKMICLLGIAYGIEHLHNKGILHRDLKPENILLDRQLQPVIGDFGLTTILGHGEMQVATNATFDCGTPYFMAPELFWLDGDSTYEPGVDVYAFGVICYSFFTDVFELDDGGGAYHNTGNLQIRVRNGARYKRIDDMPESWWALVRNCWAAADTRWTIGQVLSAITSDVRSYTFARLDYRKVESFIGAMEKVRRIHRRSI
jgi:serine/threonine protein kinase